MLQTAEEIIKYIGDAKKQTPIKMYLKGENLPDTDAVSYTHLTLPIQMHSIYLEIVILKLLLEI